MAVAYARIVVHATTHEKEAIVAKARKLGLSISELMRRGASNYAANERENAVATLAAAAHAAAVRAAVSIDEAVEFIEASNKRIAAMERQARWRVSAARLRRKQIPRIRPRA